MDSRRFSIISHIDRHIHKMRKTRWKAETEAEVIPLHSQSDSLLVYDLYRLSRYNVFAAIKEATDYLIFLLCVFLNMNNNMSKHDLEINGKLVGK